MVYSSIIKLYNKQYTYTEHAKRKTVTAMDAVRWFAPLSYKTAIVRATESECIPRGGGALAGQVGRCLKTIYEIGPHEDRVLFSSRAVHSAVIVKGQNNGISV